MGNTRIVILILACLALVSVFNALSHEPELGSARVVFQPSYGDIEFGFHPTVAHKTVDHIFKLVRLGCYNANHFFRVDKGFVAQVSDVADGRSAPMNEEQREEAEKTIVGDFSDVKHVGGTLSMGRYEDPNTAQSLFSMLLGDASYLDRQDYDDKDQRAHSHNRFALLDPEESSHDEDNESETLQLWLTTVHKEM